MAQLVEALRYKCRKFAGSIPNGVIWIFHSFNPSVRTIALGLRASIRNEYQRYLVGVKAVGA